MEDLSGMEKPTTPEMPVAETILPRDAPDDLSERPVTEHDSLAGITTGLIKREAAPIPTNSPPVHHPSSSTSDIKQSPETNIPRRSRVLLVEDSVTNLNVRTLHSS
jgi:hypothetical protein